MRTRRAEYDPRAFVDVDHVQIARSLETRVDRDTVKIGELAPLAVVRIDISADLKQPSRLCATELFESLVFFARQRCDVLLDVWVHTFMNQRYARTVTDEAECGSFEYSGVHTGAPFDSQAKPEGGLGAKGTAIAAYVAVAHSMNRTECSTESLDGSVSVSHGDPQQILATDHIRCGDGHPPPPYVLGQRHSRQRGEHTSHVIPGRAMRGGQCVDVDFVAKTNLYFIDEQVEDFDHGAPFDFHSGATRPTCARSFRSESVGVASTGGGSEEGLPRQ